MAQLICVVWTLIAPESDYTWEQLRTTLAKNVPVLDGVKVGGNMFIILPHP